MHRTCFIFLLFVVKTLFARPDVILHLYLNTNNCFQCEGSLRQLKQLDPKIPLEIHVEVGNKDILTEYLEKFDLPAARYSVKFHKRIRFDGQHHKNSFFKIIVNGSFCCRFYDDLLSEYIQGLNSLGSHTDTTFTIALPEKTVYSDYLTVFVHSDIINVNDTKLGKNLTYRILTGQNRVQLLNKLYAKDMNYEDFFALGAMDTSFYTRYREEAVKRGLLPTFHRSMIKDDALYLLFSIPYYYFRVPNVLRWDSRSFLLEKKLNGSGQRMMSVKTDILRGVDSTRYFIDDTKSFSCIDDRMVFPIMPDKYKSDVSYRYVEMNRDGDTLKPQKLRLKMKRKDVERYKLDDGLAFSNPTLGYAVNHKIIYRFANNEVLTGLAHFKSGGDVLDVRLNGAFVWFITVSTSGKIMVLLYDRWSGREIIKKHIVFPEKTKMLSPRIINEHYVVALSEKGEKLVFVSF